jgi:hypothetical protein
MNEAERIHKFVTEADDSAVEALLRAIFGSAVDQLGDLVRDE